MSKPKLFVISAPSGCGKTTIAREILRRKPELSFSVSATTREKRNGEIDGKDYFFLTKELFESKISSGDLVEWEEIFDHYYGTLSSEINRALHAGISMLFDIDVKGALSIKTRYPDDAVLIFIDPPSLQALTERLKNRKTESEQAIEKRLERVPMELEKGKEFHFRVVNNNLEQAVGEVSSIIDRSLAP